LSVSLASRKVAIINRLTHTKGVFAGQPFNLRRWQERQIIRPLFKTDRSGRRVYRTCLLMMPRKNGKSEIAAALALDGLLFDGELGAEVYSAAADKEQAALVFNVAAQMIRNDPELYAQCEILDSQKRIVHRKSGSIYRAISAEAYSKHGFNASRVIYDELHAAPNRELWDVLSSSTGARDQPLVIAISTAGYDRNSILFELYAHAKNVLEKPSLDPSFLPIIFEAPLDADWTDERVWKGCNPALDDFRSLEEMRDKCARAREIPAQENTFRRLYLNQWTEQSSRWIGLESWDACGPSEEQARPSWSGRACYLGVDLSTTTDLSAMVGVYPRDDGGFDVRAVGFIPGDNLRERMNRDRVPYDQWARDGAIIITPGNVIDFDYIREELLRWADESDVREIAYDPWNAAGFVTKLAAQDGFVVVPTRQGFASMSAPSKSFEKSVLAKTLHHDGNPALRSHVSNVSVEQDAAGNLKPSKKLSTARIDLVVALILAIDRLDRRGSAPVPRYQMLVLGGGPG
jgi:phage terminase large subunit-like protein